MRKKRTTINISLEASSELPAQSYDGIIRELVKLWKEKGGASDGNDIEGQVERMLTRYETEHEVSGAMG